MSIFKLFFRVGSVEILRYLEKTGSARYNEILGQNFVKSRETFARRMRELEEFNLIKRRVQKSKPPAVSYSLTDKGREVVSMLDGLEEVLRG